VACSYSLRWQLGTPPDSPPPAPHAARTGTRMEHTALPQRERREKRRRKPVAEEPSTGASRLVCAARP